MNNLSSSITDADLELAGKIVRAKRITVSSLLHINTPKAWNELQK
jgi:hypothetical protein